MSNFSVETKLLRAWPKSFEDIEALEELSGYTLEDIVSNFELSDTYDIFNYVQQEETCHFLKNRESQRHDKISYLFGTTKQNNEKEIFSQLKLKLTRKLTKVNENIEELTKELQAAKQNLKSKNSEGDQNDDNFSGSLPLIEKLSEPSIDYLRSLKLSIEKLLWISRNSKQYDALEFNFLLNVLLENRKQELQDLVLTGHISDYSEILKLQKHESWLTELKQKIARSEATLSTYLSYTTPLTPEIVESLGAYNPQFYQEYTDSIEKFALLHKEVGSYQEILQRLSSARENLRSCFESHLQNNKNDVRSCPFCGDLKRSSGELREEYDKQTIFFEGLKSDRTKELELLEDHLKRTFIKKCLEKENRFVTRYKGFLELQPAIREQLITEERWKRMIKVRTWLDGVGFNYQQALRETKFDKVGSELSIKLNRLEAILRESSKPTSEDANISELQEALKRYQLTFSQGKLYTQDGDVISDKQLQKYINKIDVFEQELASEEINEKKKDLTNLQELQRKLSSKEKIVKKLFNTYNSQIKDYERLVAKQISIPFYVYSSKILQTRPDGNGAFIKSSDNAKEKGYIRFVSGLDDEHDAWNSMSSGQLSGLVVSFMLAMNKVYPTKLKSLLIDDPVQTMDEINLASLVQVLRKEFFDNQIIISTHERKSANYFAYKYQQQTDVRILNMKTERLNE